MTSPLESLPSDLLSALSEHLSPAELARLSSTSRTLHNQRQELWRAKCAQELIPLYNRMIVTRILRDAGIKVSSGLDEPEDWAEFYRLHIGSKNANGQFEKEKDWDAAAEHASRNFAMAQKSIEKFRDTMEWRELELACDNTMKILEDYPGHAGCFHLIAVVMYILNRLEDALKVLEIGKAIDLDYEPIEELEQEIRTILDGYQGSEDEEPLLENGQFTPLLKQALIEIFNDFDADGDGALAPEELDNFVFTTNGDHAPPGFAQQLGMRFDSNSKGWLTCNGFLEFYLEQTLGDPEETRRDLGTHGFDRRTLLKLRISSPAA
ncbi:uncharacterized protein VTP21DRAFT_7079 [Calcarisporiella thermophila]|uniref:uncharacterized protein n=1 Tax=Calcarisporiella thermophila TaxID=911321 RepID=UPI0037429232